MVVGFSSTGVKSSPLPVHPQRLVVHTFGTLLFGTVDGVHDVAAGDVGFIRPSPAAGEQYAKLHTHHFPRVRQSLGDDGGHFGCLNPNVATALFAPLLPRSQALSEIPTAVDAAYTVRSPFVCSVSSIK